MSSFIDNIPSPFGRPPKYKTGALLWQRFLEYVKWADENPIEVYNRVSGKGDAKEQKSKEVKHGKVQRPYTLYGFIAFAGIANWSDYKQSQNAQRGDFPMVIRAIENSIKAQQIDGAMVGLFNSNLTARLNGIADTAEIKATQPLIVVRDKYEKEITEALSNDD